MANIYQTNEVILKPELTDEFLATLVKAARTCGWDVDHSETYQFVRWCFNTAGKHILRIWNHLWRGRRAKMAKGTPKKDGSRGGTRKNKGRGGCAPSKQSSKGKGSNRG